MNETIKVCAWCNPGESIYERFPQWRGLGLKISHGMCHKHKLQTKIDLVKQQISK